MGLKRWGAALVVGAALTLYGCGTPDTSDRGYKTGEFTNQQGDHCTKITNTQTGQVSLSCTPTQTN